jgi:hypothetical protein
MGETQKARVFESPAFELCVLAGLEVGGYNEYPVGEGIRAKVAGLRDNPYLIGRVVAAVQGDSELIDSIIHDIVADSRDLNDKRLDRRWAYCIAATMTPRSVAATMVPGQMNQKAEDHHRQPERR